MDDRGATVGLLAPVGRAADAVVDLPAVGTVTRLDRPAVDRDAPDAVEEAVDAAVDVAVAVGVVVDVVVDGDPVDDEPVDDGPPDEC